MYIHATNNPDLGVGLIGGAVGEGILIGGEVSMMGVWGGEVGHCKIWLLSRYLCTT